MIHFSLGCQKIIKLHAEKNKHDDVEQDLQKPIWKFRDSFRKAYLFPGISRVKETPAVSKVEKT